MTTFCQVLKKQRQYPFYPTDLSKGNKNSKNVE